MLSSPWSRWIIPLVAMFALARCGGRMRDAAEASSLNAPPSVQVSRIATVPEGTEFTVTTNKALGSGFSHDGERFTARVDTPLLATDGRVVVHRGAQLTGYVQAVNSGPTPAVRLKVHSVETARGPVSIDATAAGLQSFEAGRVAGVNDPLGERYDLVLLPTISAMMNAVGGPPPSVSELIGDPEATLRFGSELRLRLTEALQVDLSAP